MNTKCKLLSASILIISLFQLYFQYSSMMTPRDKKFYEKDSRNNVINIIIFSKNYDFNFKKLEETFDDNALMRINLLKNYTLKAFEKIEEKSENKYDFKILMLFYLLAYDLIYIILLYIFFFQGFKAGIVKIIIQIFKLYSVGKRIKNWNRDICICEIILNNFKNSGGDFSPRKDSKFSISCLIL